MGNNSCAIPKVVILPDAAFGSLMVVGGVLAAIGAIAFMLSFLIDRLEQAVSQVAYGDLDSKCLCTHARLRDLPGLYALYTRYFGDALRANIDETVLLVVITEQGENRNQCEEQRNLSSFSHGFARRGT
jgi:hypothetical protein